MLMPAAVSLAGLCALPWAGMAPAMASREGVTEIGEDGIGRGRLTLPDGGRLAAL